VSWEKVDQWHMRNGDWTMTWAPNVLKPFGLWHQGASKGFFSTREEALNQWKEIK
jgi:hypothetical protein